MTMSEFDAVMGELREIRFEQKRVGEAFAAHCAAEEALAKAAAAASRPRSTLTSIVGNGVSLLSLAVALAALILPHVR